MWVKDENGDSYYMEKVEDTCVIKIERWEHGYYVEVEDENTIISPEVKSAVVASGFVNVAVSISVSSQDNFA